MIDLDTKTLNRWQRACEWLYYFQEQLKTSIGSREILANIREIRLCNVELEKIERSIFKEIKDV